MEENTYKQGLSHLGQGLGIICQLLPKTFMRQTKKILCDHPIYILFFIAVIAFQCYTIASERVGRDSDSHVIYRLQQTIDSLQGKTVKYYSFNANKHNS